jgi:RNA polymerase sigma-70 factor (ECF subfamily)
MIDDMTGSRRALGLAQGVGRLESPDAGPDGLADVDMSKPSPVVAASGRAFEAAYGDSWASVFRFALAWTADWSAAEDLAQDAFVRLWDRRDRIDWTSPVLPWLLVTTRHLATDRFRRLRVALSGRQLGDEALGGDARIEWLDVKAGLGRLTATERAALALTVLQGFDPREAGEILGMGPNAVRAAVSRARRKLEKAR